MEKSSKNSLYYFCLRAKFVEAKVSDVNASPHLYYFRDKLKIPFSYQVVKQNGVDSFTNGIRIVSANRFLAGLI